MNRQLLLIVVVAASTSLQATDKAPPKAKAPQPSFALDRECGSIESVFREGLTPPKGPLETSAEFAARAGQAVDTRKARCFVLDEVLATYDADKEEYWISTTLGRLANWDPVLLAKETRQYRSSYKGGNAFGVTVTIKKYDVTRYEIVLASGDVKTFSTLLADGFHPRVPLAKVRDLTATKKHLKVVISGFVSGPSMTDSSETTPTVTVPTEITTQYKRIPIRPTELSFRVRETNEVLGSTRSTEAADAPVPQQ